METTQTIVIILPAVMQDDKLPFMVDGKQIAVVAADPLHKGKYYGSFGGFVTCDNVDLSEAVAFVAESIERVFKAFNINTEFKTI